MLMFGMMAATVFGMADKPKEISNTRKASCILRISFDPSVLPLNYEMLDRLVRTSGILGKVTKEILRSETVPYVVLSDIGDNGDMPPAGEPFGMEGLGGMGGMESGMGGMGMGGGMMGMGGIGAGEMTGMAGRGGEGVSIPVPPQPPVPPALPSESGDYAAVQSSPSPDPFSPDALRKQAELQVQQAQQRARQAELQALQAQRRAEQIQAQMGRSSGYQRPEQVNANIGSTGLTRTLLFHFEIELGDELDVPAATEAMEAIIDLLRGALQRDFEAYKERITKRADLARNQAAMAENEVRQLQETLRDLSPLGELHRDQILVEISRNQEKIRQIRLDRELNAVMVVNLNQQIKEARDKAERQIAEDPVMKDLQKLLDISRQRVDATEKMMAAGQAGQSTLQDAMEKLARANIELAQRKEVLGAYVGVQQINDLLQRLNEISLRSVQSEIQLTQLDLRIRELRDTLEKAVDYEILSLRLDLAREKLGGALRRADTLSDFQPEPPVVEAIGAD